MPIPVRALLSKLSPRSWAVLGASAAIAIVFFYVIFHMASAPSYSTLMTGLDPAQTGKITAALDGKGIPWQIQNNGTAIAVRADRTADARIALAGAGLSGTSQPDFSLFDKQQLGSSNFQQQVTYQRALEGQLAETIDKIQGVSGAQVQLVLPNPQAQLFSDSQSPSTAAVLLGGASALDPAAVKGIASLVSSSVPGLTLDKVTITDSSGQLLWPSADGAAAGGLLSKQAAQVRYDQLMASQVNAMLAQTLGPGKAQVQVNADLNVDQTTQDTLTYAKKGVPLQTHTDVESLAGTGGAGAAGVAGNIPGYAQTQSGNSKYSHRVTDTTLGVDKTVTHATIAPGKVNRQTVSVLVDRSVPASAIPALQAAVTNAVGLQPGRGDTLSFGRVAFANPGLKPVGAPGGGMIGYAKYALVGLGSVAFLFFVTRLLRRREHETLVREPTWLRELEAPRPLAELERETEEAQVQRLRTPVNTSKRQIEDLVERDPDRVAQQVRAWMAED